MNFQFYLEVGCLPIGEHFITNLRCNKWPIGEIIKIDLAVFSNWKAAFPAFVCSLIREIIKIDLAVFSNWKAAFPAFVCSLILLEDNMKWNFFFFCF